MEETENSENANYHISISSDISGNSISIMQILKSQTNLNKR